MPFHPIPNGYRKPLTQDQVQELINEITKRIIEDCGPADAMLVAVGVVKVIGELVRMNCPTDAMAEQLFNDAIEVVRSSLHVEQRSKPAHEDNDDDPFTIPN